MEFLELFFTDGLLENIFSKTKLFKEWQHLNSITRKVRGIEKEEIRKVIGIVLHMGHGHGKNIQSNVPYR